MDCYCDYDEPWKVYAKTERKARKVHVCRECHCRIQPGEKYEHVTGIADAVEVFKTCARCITLRDWVEAHVPCFCWQRGETLLEWLLPNGATVYSDMDAKVLEEHEDAACGVLLMLHPGLDLLSV